MADSKTLGTTWRQRLASRMETLGLTQTRLSEEMAVSQGTVNHWLSGRREPNLDTLARLSRVLNMTPAELIAGVSRDKAQIVENMTIEELRAAYATMLVMRQQSQNRDTGGGGVKTNTINPLDERRTLVDRRHSVEHRAETH